MKCPYCDSVKLIVLDKRIRNKNMIYRRRECIECKERFTTNEITDFELTELKEKAYLYDELCKHFKIFSNLLKEPDNEKEG